MLGLNQEAKQRVKTESEPLRHQFLSRKLLSVILLLKRRSALDRIILSPEGKVMTANESVERHTIPSILSDGHINAGSCRSPPEIYSIMEVWRKGTQRYVVA